MGKLMGIQEAQQVCPDIALVCGEDLSVYRACSRSLRAVLARFGVTQVTQPHRLPMPQAAPTLPPSAWVPPSLHRSAHSAASPSSHRIPPGCPQQARGLDEVTVDITALAKERLTAPGWIPRVQGHVFLASTRLVQEGMHRVQDLRAAPPQQPPSHAHSARHPLSHSLPHSANPAPGDREDAAAWRDEGTNPQDSGTRSPGQAWSDRRADGDRGGGTVGEWVERLRAEGMEDAVGVLTMLAAGSQVAMDIRRAVKEEVGLRCSAGVACNQMLAKLCSGIHKVGSHVSVAQTT